CVSGKCPNCLMNVNGVPNVRTCVEPAREGLKVRSQNCWPSLEWDCLSVIEHFSFLLPVGFYYKLFARPRWAWKTVEPLIRRMAGLGRISSDAPEEHCEHVHLHCDIAVVGGGPAGCAAALAAAEAGAEVFLIDDQEELGGHLRYYQRLPSPESAAAGFEMAQRLQGQIAAQPRIRVFSRALAFGAYEGGLLAIRQGHNLIHLRAAKRVVATGCFEYPPTFDGNDLPGVMLASGARRLITLYGLKPGAEAVVCGCDGDALALALDLRDCGISVKAVADSRRRAPDRWSDELANASIPLLAGYRIVAASGSKRVQAVELASFDVDGTEAAGSRRQVACDLLILATQYAPSAELLRQSGVKFAYDESLHQMTPAEEAADIWSAGRLAGLRDLELERMQGRLAGLRAAGAPEGDLAARIQQRERELRAALDGNGPLLLPDSHSQFVCFCEDVRQDDITQAVQEGFYELETLKRYSTVSMGPCQGRMCLMSAAALCAQRNNTTLRETGSTTARPPVEPVSLGLLAGAHHHPVKLTPMHYKHLAAGASQMDMGVWKRPRYYSSEAEEWKAVREAVGIIDVGTLGKLDVKGADAGALLDKVYTHVFSQLKPGRVRYGVICNDEGIILDDGTVSRLSDSHYFITTTTGNVDFVEAWLNWWLAGTGLCAHITNVTGDYAAVNVAGPRARDTLRKLTDADLAPEKFSYMMCRQA
ncbi:MAG TPA: FAD-dependent oxidoreductase, partial [Bryobacterales bacterium]|nr:FAD-dependent oxidoreductase [Bryobacterales bacterium]